MPDSIVVNVQTIHPRYVCRRGTSIGASGGWSRNASYGQRLFVDRGEYVTSTS